MNIAGQSESTPGSIKTKHDNEHAWLFCQFCLKFVIDHFDALMQERRNFIANALELRPSCTHIDFVVKVMFRNIKSEFSK